MKAKIFFLSLVAFFALSVQAAVVDTINVRSDAMNKEIQTVIVLPGSGKITAPVIYLLHGHGGNAKTWIGLKPNLPEIADRYGIIFVCPDGKNSWYWDSPVNPSYRYETFVAKELVNYIDANYPTIKDRTARAITGLSMGGHGGLWIGLRHPDLFGNIGSTSGGVDIRPFPKKWNIADRLGPYAENPRRWADHTVMTLIEKVEPGQWNIIFDCGTEDFFYIIYCHLDKAMTRRGIKHTFLTSKGAHTPSYWHKSIQPQLRFFHSRFYPTR